MKDDDALDLSADPRALREMVNASREAAVPKLDWSKVESRLFATIDSEATLPGDLESDVARADEKPELGRASRMEVADEIMAEEMRPSRIPDAVASAVQLGSAESRLSQAAKPKRRYGWLGAFAVAAAFALVWLVASAPPRPEVAVVSEPIDPMAVPAAPGMSGARDVAALNRGDVVEAALGPVSFGKLGVLEWTLAAGGRLAVRQALQSSLAGSENHEVELESGSLDGSVSAQHELVVVAGDTQVATVGAATLSITRSSQRLVVDLKAGSAAVGRRGERNNVRVLSAPVRASFSLDGGLKFEVIPDAPVAVVDSTPAEVAPAAPEQKPLPSQPVAEPVAQNPKPVAPAPTAPVAEPTVVEQPALADATVRSTLMSCLAGVRAKEQGSEAAGVSVSVSSTLTVQTREDGSVKSASFNPPLRAEMQSCAVFLFRSKLTGGARTLAVPVSL